MRKNNLVVISGVAVVVIALFITVVLLIRQNHEKDSEMSEMVEQMNFEKQQTEKEYSDLNTEVDGYTSNIHNDSILHLLQDQKTKVRQLLDELRVTKSTNARRIAQLKAELSTVRKVMIQYVNQIDSLNSLNKVLKTENIEVHKKYQAASQTVQQLSKEKQNLTEVVSRASMLEITNFSMIPLNSQNHKTTWFTRTATLQFKYTIGKNITAPTGEKTIYLRITRPDEDVLTKSADNVFPFENKNISYSASKKFEYTGDALSDVLYWKIDQILPKGNYRADFFADGNLIGSFTFVFTR